MHLRKLPLSDERSLRPCHLREISDFLGSSGLVPVDYSMSEIKWRKLIKYLKWYRFSKHLFKTLNRPGLAGDSISWEYRVVTNIKRYSPEVRERAVRMVFEHVSEYSSQWESICSIATKIGCTAETLRKWVRRTEVDTGRRDGVTSDERARLKELERENRELAAGQRDPSQGVGIFRSGGAQTADRSDGGFRRRAA